MKKLMLAALAATVLAGCGEQIDAGHVGLRKSWGEITAEALQPGLYWYSPIGGDIIEVNVQQQLWEGSETAYTKDLQTGVFAYKVAFRPNAADMPRLYTAVGAQWEKRLLMDLVPDTLKNVIGQWEAADLIGNRSKIAPQVLAAVQERVQAKCRAAGLPDDTVELVSFALTNIDFSDEFEKAVEAKVTAVQLAEQEKNRTVQITEQAKQQVITAKASAEAMKIQSEALAQNQNLTAYKAVEKWDGKMPYYITAGSPLPFMSIGQK
jgi:regulator of protease activity HflC (stomatin/prohibitin superfamily)